MVKMKFYHILIITNLLIIVFKRIKNGKFMRLLNQFYLFVLHNQFKVTFNLLLYI